MDDDYEKLMRLAAETEEHVRQCHQFIRRVERVFKRRIQLPRNGKPVHIPGNHNGPYWSKILVYLDSYPMPLIVLDEWKALVQKGVRLRREMEALFPAGWPLPNSGLVFPSTLLRGPNG